MKTNQKLSFTLDSYFPQSLVILGVFGIAGSLALIVVGKIFFGIVLIVISLPLSFTKRGTSINPGNKTIQEFTSIVGIKFGKDESYNDLKMLKLKERRVSQTMSSRGSVSTIRYTIYNAYLITDERSLLLTGDKRKSRISNKMEQAAKVLSIPFEVE